MLLRENERNSRKSPTTARRNFASQTRNRWNKAWDTKKTSREGKQRMKIWTKSNRLRTARNLLPKFTKHCPKTVGGYRLLAGNITKNAVTQFIRRAYYVYRFRPSAPETNLSGRKMSNVQWIDYYKNGSRTETFPYLILEHFARGCIPNRATVFS